MKAHSRTKNTKGAKFDRSCERGDVRSEKTIKSPRTGRLSRKTHFAHFLRLRIAIIESKKSCCVSAYVTCIIAIVRRGAKAPQNLPDRSMAISRFFDSYRPDTFRMTTAHSPIAPITIAVQKTRRQKRGSTLRGNRASYVLSTSSPPSKLSHSTLSLVESSLINRILMVQWTTMLTRANITIAAIAIANTSNAPPRAEPSESYANSRITVANSRRVTIKPALSTANAPGRMRPGLRVWVCETFLVALWSN